MESKEYSLEKIRWNGKGTRMKKGKEKTEEEVPELGIYRPRFTKIVCQKRETMESQKSSRRRWRIFYRWTETERSHFAGHDVYREDSRKYRGL